MWPLNSLFSLKIKEIFQHIPHIILTGPCYGTPWLTSMDNWTNEDLIGMQPSLKCILFTYLHLPAMTSQTCLLLIKVHRSQSWDLQLVLSFMKHVNQWNRTSIQFCNLHKRFFFNVIMFHVFKDGSSVLIYGNSAWNKMMSAHLLDRGPWHVAENFYQLVNRHFIFVYFVLSFTCLIYHNYWLITEVFVKEIGREGKEDLRWDQHSINKPFTYFNINT